MLSRHGFLAAILVVADQEYGHTPVPSRSVDGIKGRVRIPAKILDGFL